MDMKEQILIDLYGCKDLEDLKRCFLNNSESLSMILEAMETYKNQHEVTLEDLQALKIENPDCLEDSAWNAALWQVEDLITPPK